MEGYEHTDGRVLKLGKKPARIDPRTLQLAKYLTADIAPPPASIDWTKDQTSFGMMLNDALGDCTIAGVGHALQVASLNSPAGMITEPDADILRYYELWDGYVPDDPGTDQGGVEIDVLNQWHQQRFDGHRLFAYADPDPSNRLHVQQAIALFGIVYIGLALPISAQSQVGTLWDVVGNPATDANSAPGSWGGHCVVCIAYDAETITCITWGALQKMTWAFWQAYVDEAHALLLGMWMDNLPESPSGFDLAQLKADLEFVTN